MKTKQVVSHLAILLSGIFLSASAHAVICPEYATSLRAAQSDINAVDDASSSHYSSTSIKLSSGANAIVLKRGDAVLKVITEPSQGQINRAVAAARKITRGDGVRPKIGGLDRGTVAPLAGDCFTGEGIEVYSERWGWLTFQEEMMFPEFWRTFVEEWERNRDWLWAPGLPRSKERVEYCLVNEYRVCRDQMPDEQRNEVMSCVGFGASIAKAAKNPYVIAAGVLVGGACSAYAIARDREAKCNDRLVDCILMP